jgi:hypothetical protein
MSIKLIVSLIIVFTSLQSFADLRYVDTGDAVNTCTRFNLRKNLRKCMDKFGNRYLSERAGYVCVAMIQGHIELEEYALNCLKRVVGRMYSFDEVKNCDLDSSTFYWDQDYFMVVTECLERTSSIGVGG